MTKKKIDPLLTQLEKGLEVHQQRKALITSFPYFVIVGGERDDALTVRLNESLRANPGVPAPGIYQGGAVVSSSTWLSERQEEELYDPWQRIPMSLTEIAQEWESLTEDQINGVAYAILKNPDEFGVGALSTLRSRRSLIREVKSGEMDAILSRFISGYPKATRDEKRQVEDLLSKPWKIAPSSTSSVVRDVISQESRKALADLLLEMFGASEFHRLLGYSAEWNVTESLPDPYRIAPIAYVNEVVAALVQRGLGNDREKTSRFFAILWKERPYRKPEIDAVAMSWEATRTPSSRELNDILCKLLPAQFEEIVHFSGMGHEIRGEIAPIASRVDDLVQGCVSRGKLPDLVSHMRRMGVYRG